MDRSALSNPRDQDLSLLVDRPGLEPASGQFLSQAGLLFCERCGG